MAKPIEVANTQRRRNANDKGTRPFGFVIESFEPNSSFVIGHCFYLLPNRVEFL